MEDEINPFASIDINSRSEPSSSKNSRRVDSDRSNYKTSVKSVPLSTPDPLSALLSSTKSQSSSHITAKSPISADSKNSYSYKPEANSYNNESINSPKSPNQFVPEKDLPEYPIIDNIGSKPQLEQKDDDDLPLIKGLKSSAKLPKKSTSTSISKESVSLPAKKPLYKFDVSVTSPRKVNDVINPFTVYKISTKTDSPEFKKNQFSVSRRFRDFLWLYEQLITAHPGIVVPPPPEKHAIGRFQDDFVESRRLALEKMIHKIVVHPQLYCDPEVKVFLESDTFVNDVSMRRKESPKGFFKILGEVVSGATSSFVKLPEPDEWFETRRHQIDQLETQLKALHKSIDLVAKQRKELGSGHLEFGESMIGLASAEINQPLSKHFLDLGNLQKQLQEIHEKQSKVDLTTMATSAEEYLRLVSVVRGVLTSRSKSYSNWQSLSNDLEQKQISFDRNKSKLRADKLNQSQKEINQLELRTEEAKDDFEEMTKLVRSELERFDREKVEDFQKSVEGFLSGMMTNQEEIIRLWEDYIASLKADESSVETDNKTLTSQSNSDAQDVAIKPLESEPTSPKSQAISNSQPTSPESNAKQIGSAPPEDPSVSVWE